MYTDPTEQPAAPDLDAIEARIYHDISVAKQRNSDVAPEDFDAIVHTFVHRTDALALLTHCRALRAEVAALERQIAFQGALLDGAQAQERRLRAALIRYTDLVDLPADDYRAKYGPADFPDAMEDFLREARAALEGPDADPR